MRQLTFILLMCIVAISCRMNTNDSSASGSVDSSSNDPVQDTLISRTPEEITRGSRGEAIPETHLRDTTEISGNVVLFLRPDDERFASYEENGATEIYEVDSDFGFGIAGTMDSLARIKKYKNLNADVTTKRFVTINDCNSCPMTIDRDSINYGYILSSAGRDIITSNEVHSNNYLMEVDKYFELDDYR